MTSDEEIASLKHKNDRLRADNAELWGYVRDLREQLVAHKDSHYKMQPDLLEKFYSMNVLHPGYATVLSNEGVLWPKNIKEIDG